MRLQLPLRIVLVGVVLLGLLRAESSPPIPDDLACRQHLESLGVPAWHRAGIRGAGVKVAVLDSGFRGYRDFLGVSLPERVTVKSFRRDGQLEARDSIHGLRCAEVIHAIAPEAELLFANWEPDHPESFLAAMHWCRAQGASVISCSVVIPAWSDGNGRGETHRQLTKLLGTGEQPGDALAVACAGNLATRHWGGRFDGDDRGFHRWTGEQIDNHLTPWGSERISVELLVPAGANHVVEVVDELGRTISEPFTRREADYEAMIVRFLPQPGSSYRVRVRHEGNRCDLLHLFVLGAWLEHSTAFGSIPFPGDGAEWLTVGAIEGGDQRAVYSSCGAMTAKTKPDLSVLVPFPARLRPTPFTGTSAAAPQAAALAALIRSRHPDWSPNRVRQALQEACLDLGPTGPDPETGFGRLSLPQRP